jgi:hypothetical protein
MKDEEQNQILKLIDKIQKQIENSQTYHDDVLLSQKLHLMDEKLDRILEYLQGKK